MFARLFFRSHQFVKDTGIIVTDLNEGTDAIGSQHPFQPLVDLKVSIIAADTGQQDDFTADGRYNFLRGQQDASAFSFARQT